MALSGLRLAGFAGIAIAFNVPAALAAVYAVIASAFAFGGFVVWRGVPLDLDEKIDLRRSALGALDRLERLAARFNIRLPAAELLRRTDGSE